MQYRDCEGATVAPKSSSITKELPRLPIHCRIVYCLQRYGRRLVYGWWAWELLAALTSHAAAISLLVVLAQADGHQPQTWTVGSTELTLNTIIAAIGTVQRAALILAITGALNQHMWNWFASKQTTGKSPPRPFDDLVIFSEATCNIFSCLRLLWRTKGRRVVSIGALIIVLAIAFDASLQQLVVIESQDQREVLQNGALTDQNVLPQVIPLKVNLATLIRNAEPGSTLQSIVSTGAYGDQVTIPGALCPTGECEWPTTPSLAVCSSCVVLPAIKTMTSNSTCQSIVTYTLDARFNATPVTYTSCGGTNTTEWKLGAFLPQEDSKSYPNIAANVLSYGAPITAQADSVEETPFEAYCCPFSVCIKGYSASTSRSRLKQDTPAELATQARLEPDQKGQEWVKFYGLPASLSGSAADRFNLSYSRPPQTDTYADMLQSYQHQSDNYISQLPNDPNFQLDPSIKLELNPIPPSFWIASGSLDKVTEHAKSIAESLSSWMRFNWAATAAPDPQYAPTVTTQISVVRVRWPWIVFPLTLQVGGVIFLVTTMYTTSRRNVRPWKGDRIPLLLANLDDSIRKRASGGLANRTGLDDRLAKMSICLDFDGEDSITFRRA